MADESLTAAQARQLLAASASVLGRFQAPELFFSQTLDLSAPSTIMAPRAIPLNRPLESLTIFVKFRVAVSVGAYAAVSPEAPQNLLQLIQLTGIHKDFGNITPIRMTGATAYVWPRLFQNVGNDTLEGSTLTRASDPGRPFTSPFDGSIANHDFILSYQIPLGPMMGTGQDLKRQMTNFLYQPLDWNDSLQLQMNFGDKSALGDSTGATVAFTGWGGSGSPTVEVHLNYALLGQFANTMRSGICIRNENPLSSFTALATGTQLQLLQKQITTNVMIKSGVLETTLQSAGVTTFESLSDTLLDRTQIVVDNKPIRNNQNNLVSKSYYQRMFNTIHPEGYFVQSFVDGQNALLGYRGDGLQGGSQLQLISDIDSASANNRLQVIQEMIYGGPFPALR